MYIHRLGDINGDYGGAHLVSVHNKAVIRRAAWWWSRFQNYDRQHLDIFSNDSRQEDVAELYNGPAIVTAEERYSFSIEKACNNVGVTLLTEDNFESLCELWLRLIK